MEKEITTALENIGKALGHPDFRLSQSEHLQLIKDYKLIYDKLNESDKGHLEKL